MNAFGIVEAWWCSTCGPHAENRSDWCAVGCGRDYREMVRFIAAPPEPAEGASPDPTLDAETMDSLIAMAGRYARLQMRVHLALFEVDSWDQCQRVLLGLETPHLCEADSCWCVPDVVQVPGV